MGNLYEIKGTTPDNGHLSVEEDELADDPGEHTNGVIAVEVKHYGDDPFTPFVTVWAIDQNIAKRVYKESFNTFDMTRLFNYSVALEGHDE